jgi:2',3'-cyclic-nucleotide 2'-phosphodiesterase (5'-nucleotidase family)
MKVNIFIEEENDNIEDTYKEEETKKLRQEKKKDMLVEATRIHELLARSFYKENLEKKPTMQWMNNMDLDLE